MAGTTAPETVVYVSNAGSRDIHVPRGFNIDARATFVPSVGMDSAAMTVHAIHPGSGALEATHQYPMGTQPNWVEIVDLERS